MLARFEQLMEQAVEGSLRRVFPTTLQPVQVAKAIHTEMSMLLLRKWTDPSPKTNGTPSRCGLEVESASKTPELLGPVGPAWHINRVTSAPKLPGA